MCLNVPYKQDSEYASGPKYVEILNMTVLNMAGYSIYEHYIAS